jgi:hypothetical protein
MFSQSNDSLLGPWKCSIRQTMKVQTGRIVGSSVTETTIEFKDDHTATVSRRGEPDNTQYRLLSARWSGGPDKMTFQPDWEPGRLTGAVKRDTLKMQGDQLNLDRDILIHTEWTCTKRR